MIITRRNFLVLVAAPAIVKATSIMPVSAKHLTSWSASGTITAWDMGKFELSVFCTYRYMSDGKHIIEDLGELSNEVMRSVLEAPGNDVFPLSACLERLRANAGHHLVEGSTLLPLVSRRLSFRDETKE